VKTRTKTRPKLLRSYGQPPRKRQHIVKQLAARGLSGDVIAASVGLNKNSLRAEHALDLHEGREIRAAEKAAEIELSLAEYHFLNAATLSFSDDGWFDDELKENLLFDGVDGKGAKNIDDAFAAWKAEGGRFITTGLSSKFDPEKYAEFAKIVLRYRQNLKSQPNEE